MIIPDSFKKAIKDTFFDKTITRYSTTIVLDENRTARKSGTTVVSGSFLGNAHFDNFEQVQETYGIKDKIDMTITSDVEIPRDEIIGYYGKQYKVFEVIPNDSHYLLVCKKWSSKSSTSISA
jgi:hypothetical protein